jgi:septal ring factor EnvC (AmiA/AmiB activator)
VDRPGGGSTRAILPRRDRRTWLAAALSVTCTAAAAHGERTRAGATAEDALTARLAVIADTETVLGDKIGHGTAALKIRLRALYKLSRAGWAPLFLDGESRSDRLRRRGAARRLLARDLAELGALRREREAVAAARARLEGELGRVDRLAEPAPRSLGRPVPGPVVTRYGSFRGRRTGTRLTSRGIELATRVGEPVRAVDAGVIAYAGPLRELGAVVVINHASGLRSVTARLDAPQVRTGDVVERGAVLGAAAGGRVYFELRLGVGDDGLPIDPAPALAQR